MYSKNYFTIIARLLILRGKYVPYINNFAYNEEQDDNNQTGHIRVQQGEPGGEPEVVVNHFTSFWVKYSQASTHFLKIKVKQFLTKESESYDMHTFQSLYFMAIFNDLDFFLQKKYLTFYIKILVSTRFLKINIENRFQYFTLTPIL